MFGSKGSGHLRWATVGLVFVVLGSILSEYTVEGKAENEIMSGHNGVNDNNGYRAADGSIAKHRVKRALKSCREISLGFGSEETVDGNSQKKQVQVQWEKDGDNVKFEVAAHVEDDEYIGLGWSATPETKMEGADAVITFIKDNKGNAIDYFLSARSQCNTGTGVGACPDKSTAGGTTDEVTAVTGKRVNGHSVVEFTRPINATNEKSDLTLETERTFFVAIGKLSDPTVLVHSHRSAPPDNEKMNVTGEDSNTCVLKEKFVERVITKQEVLLEPWKAVEIRNTKVFQVDLGPPGSPNGYQVITGIGKSWGESFYINKMLIPRLFVVRGETYTFTVNAGVSHPLYITSSQEGSLQSAIEEGRNKETVFAGPKGVKGPKCEWVQPEGQDLTALVKQSKSVEEFVKKLRIKPCEATTPALKDNILTWTVAQNTPDFVYYQCYVHKFLGYEIQVFNKGEEQKTRISPKYVEGGIDNLGTNNITDGQDRMSGSFIFLVTASTFITGTAFFTSF